MPPLRTLAPWLAFFAVWALATAYLAAAGADVVFPLFSLAVFGAALGALAMWLTRGAAGPPADTFVRRPGLEAGVILAYLVVYAFVVLGWALGWVREAYPAGPAQQWAVLVLKLGVHVAVPALLLLAVGAPVACHFSAGGRRIALPLAVLGAILFALLAVVSPSLAQIGATGAAPPVIALGLLGAFVWVAVEAGLNEEFLFRAVLQTRLAVLMKSEAWAIVATSIVFALSHAPGLYLRGGPGVDGWSTDPVQVAAFTVATLAPISILFGVLWARTRSLLLVVLLHASVDALPATAEFIKTWGLA
jgi:membrane protease YdiL (CAAX protease family)